MLRKESMKDLKLGFGDIIISLVFENDNFRFKIEEPYQRFISNGKAEVVLLVHHGSIPEWEPAQTVFNPGANWSMFRYKGRYVLKATGRLMTLEADFKSGHIYIEHSSPVESPVVPINYPLDEVLMINLLARGQGVIVHACGIKDRNKGLLFIGTSGAGKSTIANLWKSQIASGKSHNGEVTILSDDRIIMRQKDRRFWVYGTPWHGDAKVCSPEKAPLEKIFFLKHAKKSGIKKMSPIDATSRLIVCSFPTFWDKKGMEFTLNFCAELAGKIPCYELGFVPDERVLELVKSI